MTIAALIMGSILLLLNPQIYITKVLSIILGVLIYVALVLLLRVFVKKEFAIMKNFLIKLISKTNNDRNQI